MEDTKGTGDHEITNNGNNGKPTFFEKCLGDLSNASASKQITLGASAGFVSGLVAMKVGKTAAMALGGAIIVLEVASDQGYIKVNWEKFNINPEDVRDVAQEVSHIRCSWMEKLVMFCREYTSFTSGFFGGFLIGLASQ